MNSSKLFRYFSTWQVYKYKVMKLGSDGLYKSSVHSFFVDVGKFF